MLYVPNQAKYDLLTAVHNLSTGTYRAMLVGTGYTPDAGDVYASTPAAYELSGTGYVSGYGNAGRIALTTLSVVINTTDKVAEWSWDALSWTGLNAGTIRYITIWKPNSNDSNSKIICTIQLSQDETPVGVNFTYTPPAGGALRL